MNRFDGGIGTIMRKAAHPSGGMGSSNPRRWRGERLHHHGDGVCHVVCAFCVVFDSWLVSRTRRTYILEVSQSGPPRLAPYQYQLLVHVLLIWCCHCQEFRVMNPSSSQQAGLSHAIIVLQQLFCCHFKWQRQRVVSSTSKQEDGTPGPYLVDHLIWFGVMIMYSCWHVGRSQWRRRHVEAMVDDFGLCMGLCVLQKNVHLSVYFLLLL